MLRAENGSALWWSPSTACTALPDFLFLSCHHTETSPAQQTPGRAFVILLLDAKKLRLRRRQRQRRCRHLGRDSRQRRRRQRRQTLSAGESATDTFAYTVSDGQGGADTAQVTITINGVNDVGSIRKALFAKRTRQLPMAAQRHARGLARPGRTVRWNQQEVVVEVLRGDAAVAAEERLNLLVPAC
jgi:hypothetical protein